MRLMNVLLRGLKNNNGLRKERKKVYYDLLAAIKVIVNS